MFDSGCCGGNAITRPAAGVRSVQAVNEIFVRLEFLSNEPGDSLYEGSSGRKYRAGSAYMTRWVDVLQSDAPALLALKDESGQPLFKQLTFDNPAIEEEVATVPAPEPEQPELSQEVEALG